MKFTYLKIIIIMLPFLLQAQTQMKGMAMIKSEDGKVSGLPGATVYWLGTKVGTTTNSKGWFTINYKPEYTKLVFSLVGALTVIVSVL